MPPIDQTPADDQITEDTAATEQDDAQLTPEDDGPVQEADDLPEEFTLADLEGLSKAEQAAVIKAQDDERAAAEAAKEPEPVVQEEEPKQAAPIPQIDVDAAAAKEAIEALAVERATLNEQYADGEISEADFNAKLDDIIDRTAEAKAAGKAADLIQQGTQQAADKAWFDLVGGYMDRYPELKDQQHLTGFDAALRAVEENQPDLSDAEKVATAHRNYGAYAHSIGAPLTQAPPAPGGKPSNKLADPGPRPDLPPTLARTPAADIQSQNDGRYAQVDRLVDSGDVRNAEKAYESMSPAEQEKYLAEVS